mgnify:CR=1 FL=1
MDLHINLDSFIIKKNQSWTCGSPLRPIHLTEEEAIQKAEEIRNDLIEGAEIISSFGPLNSEEDYEQLYKSTGTYLMESIWYGE